MTIATCEVSGPDNNGKYWAHPQPSTTPPIGPFNTKKEAEQACIDCLKILRKI